MRQFAEYGYAIASIAGFVLLTLGIAPFAGSRKARDGVVPGAPPTPDYSNPTYRLWRAHLNATEIMGVFVGATTTAILGGAPPFWVNLLAVVFLFSRVTHAIVHIGAIGAANYGPRSLIFVFGWLTCALLALMAIFSALTKLG